MVLGAVVVLIAERFFCLGRGRGRGRGDDRGVEKGSVIGVGRYIVMRLQSSGAYIPFRSSDEPQYTPPRLQLSARTPAARRQVIRAAVNFMMKKPLKVGNIKSYRTIVTSVCWKSRWALEKRSPWASWCILGIYIYIYNDNRNVISWQGRGRFHSSSPPRPLSSGAVRDTGERTSRRSPSLVRHY